MTAGLAIVLLCFFATFVLYGLSTFFYVVMFLRELPDDGRRASLFGRLGIAAHVLFLIGLGIRYAELPLVGIANVFSFLALSLVVVNTVVEARVRVTGAGAFVLGLAGILQLMSWPALELVPPEQEFLKNPVFSIHVIFAISGYTGFTLSAVYGLMYLLQFRALKTLSLGSVFKNLPALDFLGRMNIDAAFVGVITMTLSIGFGLALAYQLKKPVLTDAKFIQAVLAWGLYVGLLVARRVLDLAGQRLVRLSLACFFLFVLSLTMVWAFFKTFHQFT